MIFYFSATGNSRWAARKLATCTNEPLIYIPDVIGKSPHFSFNHGERLGLVFPIHGWRVPVIVRNFLQSLVLEGTEKPFTYAVCTAGDDIGLTIEKYLNRALTSNPSFNHLGVTKVDSAYSLIMPESYVGLPFMDVDSKEKEIRKKTEADEMLKVICEEVYDKKEGLFRLHRGHWPWINSHLLGGFFEKVLITDRPFHVVSDRCVKCGICAQVCPVGDLVGGYGKEPQWKHDGSCLTCFNCYHHCPHHAIEYGSRTLHKGQYYFK